MKFKYLRQALLVSLISLPLISLAQIKYCTTHEVTNAVLEASPEKRALLEQLERETEVYTEANYGLRSGVVKVIPTVIHVIHNDGSENLSKATLVNSIEYINQELTAQNGNLSSIIPDFVDIIGNTEFELRLAQIDVNGNCTDGITRTRSTQTEDAGENVKDLVNWNTGSRRYLQIWVVESVSGGAGGYTYLPGAASAYSNGIIIRAAQFQSSIAHEFGHWLNLKHTWGSGNENGVSCGNDNVNDTPQTIGSLQECVTSQMSCGSLDNVQNLMDYSTCGRMFTMGQASRMQSAANSSVGGRSTYWSNSNRIATGTNDGFSNVCVPVVDFSLDNALGCEGFEVTFQDESWNADVDGSWTWNWTFEGGTPATSTEQNPTVVYNTAGTYDVTLSITNSTGTESETMQNVIEVTPYGNGVDGPFFDGIESSSFPGNGDPLYAWEIDAGSSTTWVRNTSAAYSGDASVRINLRNISSGIINNLISPPLDFSDVQSEDAVMTFRMAHAQRNDDMGERLRVYASKNCGESWTLRYNKTGASLNTNGGATQSSTFIPDPEDWREETVTLANMAGEEHVLIRFEAMSDKQHYLYIDDININPSENTGIDEVDEISSVSIYPNPISSETMIELSLTSASSATIEVVDVVGKSVGGKQFNLSTGLNRLPLSTVAEVNSAGIYFILIKTAQGTEAVRFVKG